MLELKLRQEFLSAQMKGTAIDLNEMVYDRTVSDVLDITYPTSDIRNVLRAVASGDARPIVLVGDRGRGKSHILSLVHYAFQDPGAVEAWARSWGQRLQDPGLTAIALPTAFHPISVVLSNQEFANLWDVIFRWHSKGPFFRGKFEQSGTPVPSRALMEEMFTDEPTALILDELQTWFDTLLSQPVGGSPRDLAFNFIQILAELAASRPEILRLVVSVRDSGTDAYRQIHRNTPVLIDFKGVEARADRVRLIQHRLFENHQQVPPEDIATAVTAYADERVRLLFPNLSGPEQDDRRREVQDYWPFSPELMRMLQEEFLMAAAAQNDRDLMRVLVRMFKSRGNAVPILTLADVDVAEPSGASDELAALVDVVAGAGGNLRSVAQVNLEAIDAQGVSLPHARELVSALWVRSLSPRPQPGATGRELHLDITRDQPIDDNLFDDELNKLVAASFNVWEEGGRYVFKREENPKSRLIASARNDKLFAGGEDRAYLEKAILGALNPMDSAISVVSRLVVLGRDWDTDPWSRKTGDDLPTQWKEPIVVTLPEWATEERLARWLTEKVSARRNLVRFLMPSQGRASLYENKELLELSRCGYLAEEWGRSDRKYAELRRDYDKPLKEQIQRWFERVAVLRRWDFQNPGATRFTIDSVSAGPSGVLKAIEDHIASAVFEPDVFRDFVRIRAAKRPTVRALIDELMEPFPDPAQDAIPYLGETALYERIMRMASRDEVVLHKDGSYIRRQPEDIDDQSAYQRIRSRAFASGRYLSEIAVVVPQDVSAPPSGVSPSAGAETAPSQPALHEAPGGGSATPTPTPVGFAESTATYVAKKTTLKTDQARSGINLAGDLAGWNLQDRRILEARLVVDSLSFPELKELVQRLPTKVRAVLEVDIEEPS